MSIGKQGTKTYLCNSTCILPGLYELHLLSQPNNDIMNSPLKLENHKGQEDNLPSTSDSERSSSPIIGEVCESEADEAKLSNKRTLNAYEGTVLSLL